MKQKRITWNQLCWILILAIAGTLLWGVTNRMKLSGDHYEDGVEAVNLDTIYLKDSGVEVNFSDVILSNHNETRKLIVSEQEASVSTKLTDRIIKQLDFDFLKKTQTVTYKGKGNFVVDLDKLMEHNIEVDKEKKIVTIKIGHSYLQAIEIHPDDIIIDEVQEGLLARGDIELTLRDYQAIEKELRTRLEETFNTIENGQKADDIALKRVKEIYEPAVKAVDHRYRVLVEFE